MISKSAGDHDGVANTPPTVAVNHNATTSRHQLRPQRPDRHVHAPSMVDGGLATCASRGYRSAAPLVSQTVQFRAKILTGLRMVKGALLRHASAVERPVWADQSAAATPLVVLSGRRSGRRSGDDDRASSTIQDLRVCAGDRSRLTSTMARLVVLVTLLAAALFATPAAAGLYGRGSSVIALDSKNFNKEVIESSVRMPIARPTRLPTVPDQVRNPTPFLGTRAWPVARLGGRVLRAVVRPLPAAGP